MAGIGEAASIAGLVSLAGQTVQAASTLYAFFKAYKSVHPKIQEVASALEGLLNCLSNVRRAASGAEIVHRQRKIDVFAGIKDCYELLNDIETQLDPIRANTKGCMGKKLKIAAQKDYFTAIYQQLLLRWQNLATLVSSAEWLTSLETLHEVRELNAAAVAIQDNQHQSTRQISGQMTSMDSSLQSYIAQTASSNDLLQHKVDALLQASTSAATQSQIEAIENRLASCQLQLQQSIATIELSQKVAISTVKSKRKSRIRLRATFRRLEVAGFASPKSKIQSAPRASEELMRLVDTAVLIRERRGRRTYDVVAMEDPDFTALSLQQRKAMVQHLQCLRLLLWLLRKDNYMTITHCRDVQTLPSPLAREASVHSLAAFCIAYSALDTALGDHSIQLENALPWLRWKPWLQYLFDRAEDRAEDGQQIMEAIIQQWERMPPPDSGTAAYFLPVPLRLSQPNIYAQFDVDTTDTNRGCLHLCGHMKPLKIPELTSTSDRPAYTVTYKACSSIKLCDEESGRNEYLDRFQQEQEDVGEEEEQKPEVIVDDDDDDDDERPPDVVCTACWHSVSQRYRRQFWSTEKAQMTGRSHVGSVKRFLTTRHMYSRYCQKCGVRLAALK